MEQERREPKIIYESSDFMAVEKPSGLMVHAAHHRDHGGRKTGRAAGRGARATESSAPEATLVDWFLEKRPEIATVGDDPATRPGIVHRLDKETSGVMLIPKTQDYFLYLKSLFQKHEIKKMYHAIVVGVPREIKGVIDAPIGIQNGTLKRSVRSSKMQKEAITEYEVLGAFMSPDAGQFSSVAAYPKTGRTHQIRVHLKSIGHPIVGDRLYGAKTQPHWATRLMLHATAIEFAERGGGMIRIECPPPWEV